MNTPAPLPAAFLDELRAALGPENVLTAPEDLTVYAFDGTAALRAQPALVALPGNAEEVAATLKIAARHKVPVTPRGSGTGLSGGSVSEGGLVLCLLRLNRILELDSQNLTVLVEPGVITADVDEAAAAQGLFYPPDPGSMKVSTIGGNVAENSGGLRGLKYGVTRDYVLGLEVVLPDGETVWLGSKCVKDVAGYSMKDVFIGSEGTLGVITKVLLKLLPRPQARRTLLAAYATIEAAAATVSAIIAARIVPCTLEFVDKLTLACIEAHAKLGLPTTAEAILLIETDGHPAAVAEEADRMSGIARTHGATSVTLAADSAEATRLATARRSAFSALARARPTTILEDVTVPRSELARMVRFVQDVAARHRLLIATFGHMGDGNLHPTILTDEHNADEMARVDAALDEIVAETLRVGGTITGEHGVGLAKKRFLPQQFRGASLRLLRRLKVAVDPEGLLNPGKIFD